LVRVAIHVTLSPDGKWLWDGTNWIPAPPTEDPVLTTQPNFRERINNLSSRKKKLIAFSISTIIILTGVMGILYQFGFIGKTIEGEWYHMMNENQGMRFEFNSNGTLSVSTNIGEGDWVELGYGNWSEDGDYHIILGEISEGISFSPASGGLPLARYELYRNFLILDIQMDSDCVLFARKPDYDSLMGVQYHPGWCDRVMPHDYI